LPHRALDAVAILTVGLVAAKATSPSVEMMFPEPLPLTALLGVMKFPVAEVSMPLLLRGSFPASFLTFLAIPSLYAYGGSAGIARHSGDGARKLTSLRNLTPR
jgi:hypothetical protein